MPAEHVPDFMSEGHVAKGRTAKKFISSPARQVFAHSKNSIWISTVIWNLLRSLAV